MEIWEKVAKSVDWSRFVGTVYLPPYILPVPLSHSELFRRKNSAFLCLDEPRLGISLASPSHL